MKVIAINSIKGGTGKSTLSIILVNALAGAGYKCLVIDADASNNSMSFHLYENPEIETIKQKNILDYRLSGCSLAGQYRTMLSKYQTASTYCMVMCGLMSFAAQTV